jgi:hypothetical protein
MADFNSQINEKVSLNGTVKEALNVLTIPDTSYIDNRTTTIRSVSRTTIYEFSNNTGAGTFATGSFKYARITNKSTSVPVKITINGSSLNTMSYLIATGSSFMLSSTKMGIDPNTFTFENITTVELEPSGSSANIEYFIVGS